jgi:plastocyanin
MRTMPISHRPAARTGLAAALLAWTVSMALAGCRAGDRAGEPGPDSALAMAGADSAGGRPARDCAPDNGGLELPEGFCATVFADSLGHARHAVVAPNGDVYVNTWSGSYYPGAAPPPGGFLVALRDADGDGRADSTARFGDTPATGGTGGTGIGLHGGALYAEVGTGIVRFAMADGALAPTGRPDTILSRLPVTGDHPMHPFAIDSAGGLYVNLGSASNSCQVKSRTLQSPGRRPCTELETRGGIWKYDANRTGQRFSPAERYATGIRNAVGIAIAPDGGVYSTQHGRDQLAENWPKLYTVEQSAELPAEELLRLREGADYGWPACYFDGDQQKLVLAPEYGGDGGKAIGECASKEGPVTTFPAHWAPNALFFYTGKLLPEHYRGGAFITFHGSWNRAPAPQAGYQVVFVPAQNGRPGNTWETFADGFAGGRLDPAAAAHRPAGLAQAPDGAVYVTDDKVGRIWRIVYRGSGAPRPQVARGAANAAAAPPPAPRPTDTAEGAGARPVTGRTVEVKMIGDQSGYRFEPANVTIKAGDGVKWVMVSGGPHDVAFDSVPPAGQNQLAANMPEQKQPLSSPYLTSVGDSYVVSFTGVAPGKYNYICTPHRMMGMVGSVTVE